MSNLRNLFKSNIPTLIAAGIVTIALSLPPFALLALFVFPLIWIFWLPYCVYVIIRKPDKRSTQLFRVTAWFSAALLIALVHLGWHLIVRHSADSVVSQILVFQSSHHRYPSSLSELGIDEQEHDKEFRSAGYFLDKDGKPNLAYPDPLLPFSAYIYDFDKRKWKHFVD